MSEWHQVTFNIPWNALGIHLYFNKHSNRDELGLALTKFVVTVFQEESQSV